MDQLGAVLLLTGFYPLYRAHRAARATALTHAIVWVWAAWLAAVAAWLAASPGGRYLALSLAAAAGVAVLGARRPGAAAWNFVVAGLLLVLGRPYFRGLGELRLEPIDLVFLGLVLFVGAANYFPTRAGLAAALLAFWCGAELAALGGALDVEPGALPLLLAVVPWLWLARMGRARGEVGELDRAWRRFRDSFGFLWGQRMRDQFNRAAANAGLRAELRWGGARGEDVGGERTLALLRSVLQRFYS